VAVRGEQFSRSVSFQSFGTIAPLNEAMWLPVNPIRDCGFYRR